MGRLPFLPAVRALSTGHYSPLLTSAPLTVVGSLSPASTASAPAAAPLIASHLSPPPPPPPAASQERHPPSGTVSRPRRRQALNLAGKACSSSSPNHRPRCPSDLLIFTNTSSTLPMLRRLHSLPRAPHSCLPQPAGVTTITETRRRFTPRPLRRTSDLRPSLSWKEECICVVSLEITSFLLENRKAVRARGVGLLWYPGENRASGQLHIIMRAA